MKKFFLGETIDEQSARVGKEQTLVKQILNGDSSNPGGVKVTKEIMLHVVKKSGGSLQNVGESWKNDRSFILSAMGLDSGALTMEGVPEKFKSDPGVFLEACKHNGDVRVDNKHINAGTQALLRKYAETSKPSEALASYEDSSSSTDKMSLGEKIAVMGMLALNRVSIAVTSGLKAVTSSSASKDQANDNQMIVTPSAEKKVSAKALSNTAKAPSATAGATRGNGRHDPGKGLTSDNTQNSTKRGQQGTSVRKSGRPASVKGDGNTSINNGPRPGGR
ncbi:MAG: DUF4116 domain-containing protein [Legionellales bacterium]|jgi:hypothetical protein|nr:DUF4116 domain-containing protein [Legionellales bacterium]